MIAVLYIRYHWLTLACSGIPYFESARSDARYLPHCHYVRLNLHLSVSVNILFIYVPIY